MTTNPKINTLIIFTFTILAFFLYLHLLPLSELNRIKHDIVSWSLPAQATIDNLGVAYVDYLDIKPPGLILTTQMWLTIFGNQYQYYLLLHTIFLSISMFGMMRMWYLNFSRWPATWLSVSSGILFLSPSIQTQFVGSELWGLAFSVAALNLLFPLRKLNESKIFLASGLFSLSGQMKEPYMFTFITVIPVLFFYYLYRKVKLKKAISFFVLGIVSSVAIIIGYLLHYGNFHAYKEVLVLKKHTFLNISLAELISRLYDAINYTFRNLFFSKIPFTSLLIIFLIFFILLFLKNRKIRRYVQLENILKVPVFEKLLLIVFAFATFLGEAIQYRFSNHYIIPVIFSSFIFQAILIMFVGVLITKAVHVKYLKNNRALTFVGVGFWVFFTFPQYAYLESYSFDKIGDESLIQNILETTNNKDTLLLEEKKIIKNTNKNDCVIHVYGWAVGTTYFYTHRQPCTRWFLPQIMPSCYYEEYVSSIINNVPMAIYYVQEMADFNIKNFEDNVFDFSAVLKKCYFQDEDCAALYFPKHSEESMRDCLKQNYRKQD